MDRDNNDQRDRVPRPEPALEPAEGDEEIVEESLRQKEIRKHE